jgi:hypothetical protein
MARALGVTAAERGDLAGTVAAVLDRDPAAIAGSGVVDQAEPVGVKTVGTQAPTVIRVTNR